jgi:hypothetical protein
MACSNRCHNAAKQSKRKLAPGELASTQPRTDTDKADAEVAAKFITKSADYSLARSGGKWGVWDKPTMLKLLDEV